MGSRPVAIIWMIIGVLVITSGCGSSPKENAQAGNKSSDISTSAPEQLTPLWVTKTRTIGTRVKTMKLRLNGVMSTLIKHPTSRSVTWPQSREISGFVNVALDLTA